MDEQPVDEGVTIEMYYKAVGYLPGAYQLLPNLNIVTSAWTCRVYFKLKYDGAVI